MGWFITAIILAAIGIGGFVVAASLAKKEAVEASKERDRYYSGSAEADARLAKRIFRGISAGFVALAGLFMVFSMVFTQGVGEAKVVVNLDGTIAGEKLTPGFGVKAPWQETVDFDLFSQELLYAGSDEAPSYSGGQVNGKEITISVGGLDGGSTAANLDASIVYSLDAGVVTELYSNYKSQERFTKQVVEKTILSIVRQVPSSYTANEFRGPKKQEASDEMQKQMNERLNKLGIEVEFVNLQAPRFSEAVETALSKIEEANQKVQEAEATQRTRIVEAETKRIEAQGVADANAILNTTLTPEVLQQKYIDALKEGTIYVVPDGSTPFIGTK